VTSIRRAWRAASLRPGVRPFTEGRIWLQWWLSGRPVPPPPPVKHRLLKRFRSAYGLRVFIETGTFAGETVAAMLDHVDRIVSIELDASLAAAARARFAGRPEVTILQGDSSELLGQVLDGLTEPCLVWLDGHYSGSITAQGAQPSPISAEVDAILRHPVRRHVVLIDDARDFSGRDGYPRIAELRERILSRAPGSSFDVLDDIIRWIGPDAARHG
jgi:hypothetical protein